MRVFLAYPFTQLLDSNGLLKGESKEFILSSIKQIEQRGHSVFSAQRREDFGEALMTPEIATELDFNEMKNADLVVAFPGQFPISGGVHVELGWASALQKQIILFIHKDERYSPMVDGLHTVTSVTYVEFDDTDSYADLGNKIIEEINRKNQSLISNYIS